MPKHQIGDLIYMSTEVGMWSGLILGFRNEHYTEHDYVVWVLTNEDYPDQVNTQQHWTAHGDWKIKAKRFHMIQVGNTYAYPGPNVSFKFLVLEDEETVKKAHNTDDLVKIWIFEDNRRKNAKPGVCFLSSKVVELLEPLATVP
jgi:hypothetical protein